MLKKPKEAYRELHFTPKGMRQSNPRLRSLNFIPNGMRQSNPRLRLGNSAFTFIEILIFTAIISFLFIAMTSTVISSLQRMQITEHRLYANRHAEELVEWLRSEKEANWEAFVARDTGNGSGTPYCFNNQLNFLDPAPVWPAGTLDGCNFTGVGTPPLIYRRYTQLTAENSDQVNIQIIVEWREGNKYFSVPINTVFTNIDENVSTP